jgi:hypothetical protein
MANEVWAAGPGLPRKYLTGAKARKVAQSVNRVPAGSTTTEWSRSANTRASHVRPGRQGDGIGCAAHPDEGCVALGGQPHSRAHILGLGAAPLDSPNTVNVIGSLLVHATQSSAALPGSGATLPEVPQLTAESNTVRGTTRVNQTLPRPQHNTVWPHRAPATRAPRRRQRLSSLSSPRSRRKDRQLDQHGRGMSQA